MPPSHMMADAFSVQFVSTHMRACMCMRVCVCVLIVISGQQSPLLSRTSGP